MKITTFGKIELREGADKAVTLAGYGAVFHDAANPGTEYRSPWFDGWTVSERIAAGAFDEALKRSDDVIALWGHDSTKPLGRQSRGTLKLSVDGRGLAYEIKPPSTSWGVDAVESIRRGDVEGSSFGFHVAADGWSELVDRATKTITRTITKIERLFEVSPVAMPAYPATAVEARSAEDDARLREIIRKVESNTFQAEKAKAMVAVALANLGTRE